MSDFHNTTFEFTDAKGAVVKGLIGTTAPFVAVLNSLQQDIEWALRIAGLIAGLTVSVLTIISFFTKRRK